MKEVIMTMQLAAHLSRYNLHGIYSEMVGGKAVITDCKKSPFELLHEKDTKITELLTKLKENGIEI